jgi:probable rRNA maturation factor
MLRALGLPQAELSILLTGDAEIRALNRAYRGKDESTDVLAFAMREGDVGAPREGPQMEILGDVVVSVPTAKRQARKARRTVQAELMTLLGHGLLHLLGFDHQTRAALENMRARTRALCRAARKPEAAAR